MLDPLASAAQYANLVGDNPPGLQQLLASASAMVRRYCGWHIAPVITESVLMDGSGSRLLMLPTLRLVGVTSVVDGGLANIVIDPAVPGFWTQNGWLYREDGWSQQLRGVAVTYQHGFDQVLMDDLVALVCTMAARAASTPTGAVSSEVSGGNSITYGAMVSGSSGGTNLLANEKDLLGPYRLPRIA